MSNDKKILYSFLLLVAAFLFLRLPTLFELPGLDQTVFAYIGQKMREGQFLYRDLWDHKPPGIFFFYSGLSYLGSGVPWVIPLTDLCYTLLTMGVCFLLAKTWWGPGPALGSALAFALFSLSPAYQGIWSRTQAEMLMNLPLLLCFYGGYLAFGQPKLWPWFLSGLALGVAFSIKFTALLLALPLVPLLWASPSCSPAPQNFRLKKLLLLISGLMTVVAAAVLYFYLQGNLGEAYQAMGVFNRIYSSLRVNLTQIPPFLWVQLRGQGIFTLALLLLALLGLGREKIYRSPGGQMVILWVVAALLAVYLQGKYLWYHFLSLVPPLSLAAGSCWGWWQKKNTGKIPLLISILIMALLTTALWDGSRAYLRYYSSSFGLLFKKVNYNQAVRSLPANAHNLDLLEVGRFIAQNTEEKDYLYVWGIAPQIYYYAGRPAANRFIFHHYLMDAENPLALKFPGVTERQQELLKDLKVKPVKFFLVVVEDTNIFEPKDSLSQLRDFKQLDLYVKDNFSFIAQKDHLLLFQKKEPAAKK